MFNIPSVHEAGYICSMLFIIPGFPFITSGIDLAKLDLRSGIERLTYSIIIVLVATVFAWIMALLLHLQPEEFTTLHIGKMLHLILRLIASFCGVFGFSIMFNSSVPMAAMAALIGCIANTLRLELVDFTGMPARTAFLLVLLLPDHLPHLLKNYNGYPRISLTVPSIVIMVPGLYLYRAIYNFGHNVPDRSGLMVYICNYDNCCTSARTYICQNYYGPHIPLLHLVLTIHLYKEELLLCLLL